VKRREFITLLGGIRREFITLLGGVAAWPLAARGQQATAPRLQRPVPSGSLAILQLIHAGRHLCEGARIARVVSSTTTYAQSPDRLFPVLAFTPPDLAFTRSHCRRRSDIFNCQAGALSLGGPPSASSGWLIFVQKPPGFDRKRFWRCSTASRSWGLRSPNSSPLTSARFASARQPHVFCQFSIGRCFRSPCCPTKEARGREDLVHGRGTVYIVVNEQPEETMLFWRAT
jgi:hypothetical protein